MKEPVVPRMWRTALAFSAGAGIVIAFFMQRDCRIDASPSSAIANTDGNAELVRLRQELQEVRREASGLRQLVHNVAQANEANGRERLTGSEAGAGQSAGTERDRTPTPPTTEEYWTFVEADFAGQRPDPTWNAPRELKGKLASTLPQGAAVRSLECGSSMCRLETSHIDAENYGKFTDLFAFPSGPVPIWEGAAAYKIVREPTPRGGDLVAVTYLARNDLPAFPNE